MRFIVSPVKQLQQNMMLHIRRTAPFLQKRLFRKFSSCYTNASTGNNINRIPIIERLKHGEIIIGDGGLTYCLEKRGYVTANNWTPEAVVEHPDAVRQVHREFALAGADVLQAFVFNGTDERLNQFRGKEDKLNCDEVNYAGCQLVTEVAKEFGKYIAFPISTTAAYEMKLGKKKVQDEFERQLQAFKGFSCDLLIAEYIGSVEEAEWAIEVLRERQVPIAVSLSISHLGDFNDVSPEECGRRLTEAGADIIGTNCRFAPNVSLDAAIMMKNGIEDAGMSSIYMCQPNGWEFPCRNKLGISEEPECPFAMESLTITRWDAQQFARRAFENGMQYIGGCCGMEPYHIRAIAEELHQETGRLPMNSRGVNASALQNHPLESMRAKANKEFWYNLIEKKNKT